METKLVFISNFLSPHQLPICRQFDEQLAHDFCFIATKPINEERLRLGYADLNQEPFVLRAYESEESMARAMELAEQAKVVIIGSASDDYILKRLKQGKLTFKYTERLLKKKPTFRRYPRYVLGTWLHHGRFMKYPLYLLCSGAFVAEDFHRLGYYKNRCYRWGYFPQTKIYDDINALVTKKELNSILWAGRFIDWKHPEYAIELAARLKAEGYGFRLQMIGTGNMQDVLNEQIRQNGLSDCVELLGSMPPESVRKYMEKSEIYLVTSDRYEGWGAVVNEAMNSACAVVSGDMVGAAPCLIRHGENGMLFRDGSAEDLYKQVKALLDAPESRKRMAFQAYQTIASTWNEEVAAKRFLALICNWDCTKATFKDGPCSKIVTRI